MLPRNFTAFIGVGPPDLAGTAFSRPDFRDLQAKLESLKSEAESKKAFIMAQCEHVSKLREAAGETLAEAGVLQQLELASFNWRNISLNADDVPVEQYSDRRLVLEAAYHLNRDADIHTALGKLDTNLAAALDRGDIVLLRVTFLHSLAKLQYRQVLESPSWCICPWQRDANISPFLSSAEAVSLLRDSRRKIGALTYGWGSGGDPDPDAAYLRAVQTALRDASCSHIEALFWDYASLYQHPPGGRRTAEQEAAFKRALSVMADVYASPLGTTVLRHKLIPPRPVRFDGCVRIFGVPEMATEEAMRGALIVYGDVHECKRETTGAWAAMFATHEQALAASKGVPPVGAEAIDTAYNERPYSQRGWTTLETAVATEAIAQFSFMRDLGDSVLKWLPPKVLDIGGGGAPEPVVLPLAANGNGLRVKAILEAIGAATFTGKGDRDVVVQLYRNFIAKIGIEVNQLGMQKNAEYVGEHNSAGQPEGRGKITHADGNVYEGEMKAGMKEGKGKVTFFYGDIYDGEWKADKKHGLGVYTFSNLQTVLGRYSENEAVGDGVQWSADRTAAGRVRDWTSTRTSIEEISVEEGKRMAKELGLPVPPVLAGCDGCSKGLFPDEFVYTSAGTSLADQDKDYCERCFARLCEEPDSESKQWEQMTLMLVGERIKLAQAHSR